MGAGPRGWKTFIRKYFWSRLFNWGPRKNTAGFMIAMPKMDCDKILTASKHLALPLNSCVGKCSKKMIKLKRRLWFHWTTCTWRQTRIADPADPAAMWGAQLTTNGINWTVTREQVPCKCFWAIGPEIASHISDGRQTGAHKAPVQCFPARIRSSNSTPFPRIWRNIMEKANSRLHKYDNGESHWGLACNLRARGCVRPLKKKKRKKTTKKTSCQVWNSESAEGRGGLFADRLLVRPRPTPTLSLWCLCAFVNEEILVPWWDIAVSWADSASSLPSAPRTVTPASCDPTGPLAGAISPLRQRRSWKTNTFTWLTWSIYFMDTIVRYSCESKLAPWLQLKDVDNTWQS